MKLTIGLQQTIVTVKRIVKNRQRSDFVGQIFLYFPFIAHISNAIMSNQNAHIQRNIYEMYSVDVFTSLCETLLSLLFHSRVFSAPVRA